MEKINSIIESIKKNEEFATIIETAVLKFQEKYRESLKEIYENVEDWRYDKAIQIDYQSVTEDFVKAIEDVYDIDIDEYMKSEEYQIAEDNNSIDINGCFDDKYQIGLYILTQVSKVMNDWCSDIMYSSEMMFDLEDIDYENLEKYKDSKEHFDTILY